MTSTDSLILDLSTRLAPVKRRNVRREAFLLIALCVAELVVFIGMGFMRPDMGQVISTSFMAWKIGSLALLAAASCVIAVRSFSPPVSSRKELGLLLGLAALAMLAAIFVSPTADSSRPFLDRLSPIHGMLCAISIVVLSLPIMATLGFFMRRAAPVCPRLSALAAGLAASTSGALIFTACCPINDPLYVIIWYSAGVAVVSAVARWLLPRRFQL